MRVLWRYGLPILLVACVVHVAAVLAVPIVVMHAVMARIEAMAGLNAPLHAPPIDAGARRAVAESRFAVFELRHRCEKRAGARFGGAGGGVFVAGAVQCAVGQCFRCQ